jgi:hypothetical protein
MAEAPVSKLLQPMLGARAGAYFAFSSPYHAVAEYNSAIERSRRGVRFAVFFDGQKTKKGGVHA